MDYTSTNPKAFSPADDSDEMADFSATKSSSFKDEAIEKAKNFRNFAGEKAAAIKEGASALKEGASVKIKQGKVKAKELHTTAEDYIKDNPTKSVLGAVGIGVIIGLILRR